MKCVICKEGDTKPGKVSVTLQREGSTIIFREVPASVCDNCGEYYLTEDLTEELLVKADAAVKNGAEIEILRYAA
jgi:YgiT-type zinc finger domain-containing protein